MKRLINLLGFLLVFLILFTSNASAVSNFSGNNLNSTSLKNYSVKSGVRDLSYGEYIRGWHNWYHVIINKPFYLHMNDVFIGKMIISRDNRLEISSPISKTLMTRVTFENHRIMLLQDTGRPNLGLGVTSRLCKGLSLDTSVNFDLRNPSDVTYLLTIPAIRF